MWRAELFPRRAISGRSQEPKGRAPVHDNTDTVRLGKGIELGQAASPQVAEKDLQKTLRGMGRGFGGALIFAMPMFMTMEMWWLGFSIDRSRLVLLLVVNIPLLVMLSYHAGFEKTSRWRDDIRDASIAFGIGIVTSAVLLTALALITPEMTADEIVGKVAVQTVPASFGALLGSSQLGVKEVDDDATANAPSYSGEMFLRCIGALFLGLNVAPTEEMVLISYKMTHWHAVALVILSIAVMHGFTYALEFSGSVPVPDKGRWHAFMRYTIPGYVVAIGVSLYVLWTFGQTDAASATQIVMAVVVLGLPASIGAAAARLIL